MEITEKAPAKINLGLDVLRKRDDGYHDIDMVMTSVDLADHLTITAIPEKEIVITTDSSFLPTDKKNHVYQAAQIVMERYNPPTGIHVHIQKRIPVAAGLGGGSSDCAAVLRAMNKLWDLGLSLEELAAIGAEVGTDVPYCVYGNTQFARGRGDELEELTDMPCCYVILVKPRMSISTPKIFKLLEVEKVQHPDMQSLREAVESQDYEKMVQSMGNSLEDLSIEKCPSIKKIKDKMMKFGADVSMMSGSGPTVFCLVKQEKRAQRIYNALKGFNEEIYMVRTLKGTSCNN
jgi:4-diphosphocytidyl-2C-methyl-D-erythritol kinase